MTFIKKVLAGATTLALAGLTTISLASPALAAPGDPINFGDAQLEECFGNEVNSLGGNWTPGEQLIEGDPYVDSLQTVDCAADVTSLEGIQSFPLLSVLTVRGNIEDLQPVGSSSVRYFNTYNNDAIYDLQGLSQANQLNGLSVTSETLGSVDGLENSTVLTDLKLYGSSLFSLSGVSNTTSLQNFSYSTSGTNNNSINWEALAGLNLNSFQVRGAYPNVVELNNLDFLANSSNLTIVDVAYTSTNNISGLTNAANLSQANFSFTELADLTPLANKANLGYVTVEYSNVTDVTPLSTLPNIVQLGLDNNKIVDMSSLASLSSLQRLTAYSNQISDISFVAQLNSLTYLGLESNLISDATPINNLPSLETVILSNNQLATIDNLSLPNVVDFLVRGNQIRQIENIVTVAPSATNIDLSGNQLTDLRPLAGYTNLESYTADAQFVLLPDATVGEEYPFVIYDIDGSNPGISSISANMNYDGQRFLFTESSPTVYLSFDNLGNVNGQSGFSGQVGIAAIGEEVPPVEAPVVTGEVFVDTNKNGIRDNGEVLYNNDVFAEFSTPAFNDFTIQNGSYTLDDITVEQAQANSTASITVLLPSGYTATTPLNATIFTTAQNGVITGNFSSFGIVPQDVVEPPETASVQGQVFVDTNGNGVREDNEELYQGDIDATFSSTDFSPFTFTQGYYDISDVPSEVAQANLDTTITVSLPATYVATTPLTDNIFEVDGNGELVRSHLSQFGIQLIPVNPTTTVVTGEVFVDTNSNGIRDNGEVLYDGDASVVFNFTPPVTTNVNDGVFSSDEVIVDESNANNTVSLVLPDTYVATDGLNRNAFSFNADGDLNTDYVVSYGVLPADVVPPVEPPVVEPPVVEPPVVNPPVVEPTPVPSDDPKAPSTPDTIKNGGENEVMLYVIGGLGVLLLAAGIISLVVARKKKNNITE